MLSSEASRKALGGMSLRLGCGGERLGQAQSECYGSKHFMCHRHSQFNSQHSDKKTERSRERRSNARTGVAGGGQRMLFQSYFPMDCHMRLMAKPINYSYTRDTYLHKSLIGLIERDHISFAANTRILKW